MGAGDDSNDRDRHGEHPVVSYEPVQRFQMSDSATSPRMGARRLAR